MSTPMNGSGASRAAAERELWREQDGPDGAHGMYVREARRSWPGGRARPAEASLGEEVRQLFQDGSALLQAEVDLAKLEISQAISRMTSDISRIGIAGGVALLAVLCLTAFLVIGLGGILAGKYWLSALIVGVVLGGIAYGMVKSALADLKKNSLKPEQTLETLQRDKAWAARETAEFKRRFSA